MEYKVEVEHRVYMFAEYSDALNFYCHVVGKARKHSVFPHVALYWFTGKHWKRIGLYGKEEKN